MQYSVPYLPPVVQVLWNHQPSILQCSAKRWQCYSSVPVFHQNYSYNTTYRLIVVIVEWCNMHTQSTPIYPSTRPHYLTVACITCTTGGTCNQVMRLPISYIACISHTLLIKLELTDCFTASGMTPLTSCASSPTCLLRGWWVAVPPPSPSTPSSSWYSYSCNWDMRWRWSEWST